MRWHYLFLIFIYLYSIFISKLNGIHTIILLIALSIMFLIFYKIIKDIILFIVFSVLVFATIYSSSISYNPYSMETFLLFSIPVTLSIIFIEIEISPFSKYFSPIIKNVSKNAVLSIALSYILIIFFSLFIFVQRDILIFSLLLSIIIIAFIYFLKTLNNPE